MKQLLLFGICLIGVSAFAQQFPAEIAPNINMTPDAVISRDTFNLQFTFPCAAFVGEYGVATDGTNIYVTQWLDDSIAKYDQLGNVIETFVIPGVGHVRDLTWDGQYYYGSPNDFFYYILDLDNKTLIDTVTTSFRIRGMAYDPVEDVLWASEHWTPMFYKMDMQGNILDSWYPSGVTLDAISGLAFDNDSQSGPFLWGYSQDSTGAIIIKYDIANQTQTGNMIDVSGLGSSIAGGLFLNQMASKSGPALGGMLQNELIFAFDLTYANQLVNVESFDMITYMEVYPNPASDLLYIDINIEDHAELVCSIINQSGQLLNEQVLDVESSTTINFDISALSSGIHYVRISNNHGYYVAKKFIITK